MSLITQLFGDKKKQKLPLKELATRIKNVEDASANLLNPVKSPAIDSNALAAWQTPNRHSVATTGSARRRRSPSSVEAASEADKKAKELEDADAVKRLNSWKTAGIGSNKLQLIENMDSYDSQASEDVIEVEGGSDASSSHLGESFIIGSQLTPSTPSMLLDAASALSQSQNGGYDVIHKLLERNQYEDFEKLLNALLEKHAHNPDELWSKAIDFGASKCTLLHKAAKYNNIPIMNLLVDKGHPIDAQDVVEATPLFYAVVRNHPKAVTMLLTKGANVNVRDVYENSPFLLAMRHNHLHIANTLLLFSADISFKGKRGNTALHAACEEAAINKVKFLLETAGANPSIVSNLNRNNETPLYLALKDAKTVEYILKFIQDRFESSKCLKIVQQQNQNGQNVFHRCCEAGFVKTFLTFASVLPDTTVQDMVNTKDKIIGNTPLMVAVINKQIEMVRVLSTTSETEIDEQNTKGETALHIAVKIKNTSLARILIKEGGASTKIKNAEGVTPKELATKLGINLKSIQESSLDEQLGSLQQKKKTGSGAREELVKQAQKNTWKENLMLIEIRQSSFGATVSKTPSAHSAPTPVIEASEITVTSSDASTGGALVRPEIIHFGLPAIDAQNVQIVEMANTLHKHLLSQSDQLITAYVLGSCLNFAEKAFAEEDKLLKKYSFSVAYVTRHVDMHEDFRTKIKGIYDKFIKGEDFLEFQLLNLFSDWIREHILVVDKFMCESVKQKLEEQREEEHVETI